MTRMPRLDSGPGLPRIAAAATLAGVLLAAPKIPALGADAGAAAQPGCAAPPSTRIRLDHVPVAVRDLDAATRSYRALGFSFKPGRPHANSILNQHVKFVDGTEVELITATKPRDELARDYVSFIRDGDGGAFLSLSGGGVRPISAAIRRAEPGHRIVPGSYAEFLGFPTGHGLRYLFFVHLRVRPVDLPEHLNHANTAVRFAGVWLLRADPAREERLLARLGARACRSTLRLPVGAVDREVRLANGSVYLVRDPGAPPRRAVAGVTLEVRDLAAARGAISLPDSALRSGRDARGDFLRVPPAHAHGIWLELLRPAITPSISRQRGE